MKIEHHIGAENKQAKFTNDLMMGYFIRPTLVLFRHQPQQRFALLGCAGIILVIVLVIIFSQSSWSSISSSISSAVVAVDDESKKRVINTAPPSHVPAAVASAAVAEDQQSSSSWRPETFIRKNKHRAIVLYPEQAPSERQYLLERVLGNLSLEAVLPYSLEIGHQQQQQQQQSGVPHPSEFIKGNVHIKMSQESKNVIQWAKEEENMARELVEKRNPACNSVGRRVVPPAEDEARNSSSSESESNVLASGFLRQDAFAVRVLVIQLLPHMKESLVRELMRSMRPQICIALSDEAGFAFKQLRVLAQSRAVWHRGFPFDPRLCSLILLNYRRHPTLQRERPGAIFQLPLGFSAGSVARSTFKLASERPLQWSFVGTIHEQKTTRVSSGAAGGEPESDRQKMIAALRTDFGVDSKHFLFESNKSRQRSLGQREMMNKYSDSVFVPIPRGHYSLETFRIYEALEAGAIPLLAASEKELRREFSPTLLQDLPWVASAGNWRTGAVRVAKEFLLSPKKWLDGIQQQCMSHWYQIQLRVQARIGQEIENVVFQWSC